MKDLVDRKKLKEMMEDLASQEIGGVPYISRVDIRNLIIDCTLSPADLAGILKGYSWVLEELKKTLQEAKGSPTPKTERWDSIMDLILEEIQHLESQAPTEILKGDSWVLEELKKRILKDKQEAKTAKEMNFVDVIATYECVEAMLEDLESQAPAALAKEAEDNERLAMAWEILRSTRSVLWGILTDKNASAKFDEIERKAERELLAQSEIPPKAKEENHD